MKKTRSVWAVLLAAGSTLLAAGCDGPPSAGPVAGGVGGGSPAASSVPAGPLTVAATRVVSERVAKSLRLPAEISAFRNVPLYSKISVFVERIDVDRGSEVKAGQLLVRLVAPEIAAQRQEAEAKLGADEATHRRLAEAAKTPGVVASNDLEIAAKNVEASRARVRILTEQESYLRIIAPFDGVITERNAHEGSLVGPPSGATPVPLLRIQELARLRVTVAVPEMAAAEVPVGRSISFTVPSFPGQTFSGRVARLARSLDAKTRSMPVELEVDNADGRLQPGAFAEVQWVMERAKPSFLVPATAVATTSERSFVIRIRDGVAEWVDVRSGVSVGDRVEVFCDLKEGDLVATRATDELRAGTKVGPKEAPQVGKK